MSKVQRYNKGHAVTNSQYMNFAGTTSVPTPYESIKPMNNEKSPL
jgi:hypothetical protein